MSDDLASGVTTICARFGVAPLFVGAAQITSGSGKADVALRKYQLCAFSNTGGRHPIFGVYAYDPVRHRAKDTVIVSQDTPIGAYAPYWDSGHFNDAAIVWPDYPQFDTYEKRKAFFAGTNIRIGRVY